MMFPDGSMSRRFDFPAGPLDEGYRMFVEEHISTTRTHVALVWLHKDGVSLIKVRIGIRADRTVIVGTRVLSRAPGYEGDWLPPLFSLDDFVEILLTPS